MTREIPLTQGKVALVDDEDYERVSHFKWHAHRDQRAALWYARRTWRRPQRGSILLHRLLLNAPRDKQVDHINGDGLDNRRCNLRLCSHAENMRNSRSRSGLKGATFDKRRNKWYARICVNRRQIFLGFFDSEEEAHASYCAASICYHGAFGRVI